MKKTVLCIFCCIVVLVSKAQSQWGTLGNDIFNTNVGYVGIGTATPTYPLDVNGLAHFNFGLVSESQSAGAINSYFRGISNYNANLVIQAGGAQAYWITGAPGVLRIGNNGGTEPSSGVLNITWDGKVGIGTENVGSFKFAVEGKLGAREVHVTLQNPWPDFVFHKNYNLLPLNQLRNYIQQNNHLPDVPSAEEVEKNGIDVGEMNVKLLKKIEELTLYVLELSRENEEIKIQLNKIKGA